MNEGRSTISGSGRGKRNSLWPTGSAVNDCKEMGVARGRGKRAHKINMEMGNVEKEQPYVEEECGHGGEFWQTGRTGRNGSRQ